MGDQSTPTPDPKFLHIPYGERWQYLKPAIVKIYIDEKENLARLSQRMKDELDFDAL